MLTTFLFLLYTIAPPATAILAKRSTTITAILLESPVNAPSAPSLRINADSNDKPKTLFASSYPNASITNAYPSDVSCGALSRLSAPIPTSRAFKEASTFPNHSYLLCH